MNIGNANPSSVFKKSARGLSPVGGFYKMKTTKYKIIKTYQGSENKVIKRPIVYG
jgi:hypothetical protein